MALPAKHGAAEPDARYLVQQSARATLVDSCVLIDVLADDPQWADWSLDQLEACAARAPLVINPLILAEISLRFARARAITRPRLPSAPRPPAAQFQ